MSRERLPFRRQTETIEIIHKTPQGDEQYWGRYWMSWNRRMAGMGRGKGARGCGKPLTSLAGRRNVTVAGTDPTTRPKRPSLPLPFPSLGVPHAHPSQLPPLSAALPPVPNNPALLLGELSSRGVSASPGEGVCGVARNGGGDGAGAWRGHRGHFAKQTRPRVPRMTPADGLLLVGVFYILLAAAGLLLLALAIWLFGS